MPCTHGRLVIARALVHLLVGWGHLTFIYPQPSRPGLTFPKEQPIPSAPALPYLSTYTPGSTDTTLRPWIGPTLIFEIRPNPFQGAGDSPLQSREGRERVDVHAPTGWGYAVTAEIPRGFCLYFRTNPPKTNPLCFRAHMLLQQ